MTARTPVRRSLLRRITWFGGDRRFVGLSGLALFVLGLTMFMGFGFFYAIPFIVPIVLFLAILWVARKMNAADPWMIDILMRHYKYKKYYAPKPDRGTEHPQVRDFV